jgi:hypothetical protein
MASSVVMAAAAKIVRDIAMPPDAPPLASNLAGAKSGRRKLFTGRCSLGDDRRMLRSGSATTTGGCRCWQFGFRAVEALDPYSAATWQGGTGL